MRHDNDKPAAAIHNVKAGQKRKLVERTNGENEEKDTAVAESS